MGATLALHMQTQQYGARFDGLESEATSTATRGGQECRVPSAGDDAVAETCARSCNVADRESVCLDPGTMPPAPSRLAGIEGGT